MGRPRKHRLDLPERVYFHHGKYFYVKPDGKWENLGNDYAKAMAAWATKIDHAPQAATTIGELLDRYLLEVVPNKAERTQADNRQEVRFLRTFFGRMVCTHVEPRHIAEYVDKRAAKTRANREVALLSHAFNKARLWGICTSNPCSVPGIRNAERARDRYVTDQEIENFKKECPSWLKDYVDLKLLLGLRQGDMLKLSWLNVAESSISVATQKTSKRLAIQRTPEINEILDRLPKGSQTLFATRSGSMYSLRGFKSTWQRAMAKYVSAGGQRFTEHDLRGKVATDIADPVAAKALLGHTKMAMTEAYIKQRTIDVVQPHTRRKK